MHSVGTGAFRLFKLYMTCHGGANKSVAFKTFVMSYGSKYFNLLTQHGADRRVHTRKRRIVAFVYFRFGKTFINAVRKGQSVRILPDGVVLVAPSRVRIQLHNLVAVVFLNNIFYSEQRVENGSTSQIF